ncbi:MAG TPA: HesA/MoeB/ThiF family protein, partial [Thermoanaerobaculia bacterium]|nr:HesA/MoeB/ThiF family protein [Thermoanaerobaculia bacterium]
MDGSGAKDQTLSPEEIRRYSRHLLLPEVGLAGQERLKRARVLLIGSGGLGSPLALYLAAAGVGTIGIVDFDRVEESNLQRQVIFSSDDIGAPKTEVAARRVRALNPEVTVEPHDGRVTGANVDELISGYDL